ncbi:MAG: helix-turn-helix domain-containing protein [Vicinamibacterales bacterium]
MTSAPDSRPAAQTSAAPTPATLFENDAANYVGFSTAYLRLCRSKGRGPAFIRVGRSIRYRVADLDAWLDAHRVEFRNR